MVKKESHPQQIILKRYEKEILTPGIISLYFLYFSLFFYISLDIFIDIIYTSNPHVSFIFVFITITIFISMTISLTITMSITINIFVSISITALIFVTVLVFCFYFCFCLFFCLCFHFCFCFLFCFCSILFSFSSTFSSFYSFNFFCENFTQFFFQKSPKSSEEKIRNIRDEKGKVLSNLNIIFIYTFNNLNYVFSFSLCLHIILFIM